MAESPWRAERLAAVQAAFRSLPERYLGIRAFQQWVLFRAGSAEIGGLIELVEWEPGRELAWTR